MEGSLPSSANISLVLTIQIYSEKWRKISLINEIYPMLKQNKRTRIYLITVVSK
jgi:hypothetical protein